VKHKLTMQQLADACAPRFSTLTVCIRGALRGFHDPVVRHMIERNREVEMMRALLARGGASA
jgi:hypothetical protein